MENKKQEIKENPVNDNKKDFTLEKQMPLYCTKSASKRTQVNSDNAKEKIFYDKKVSSKKKEKTSYDNEIMNSILSSNQTKPMEKKVQKDIENDIINSIISSNPTVPFEKNIPSKQKEKTSYDNAIINSIISSNPTKSIEKKGENIACYFCGQTFYDKKAVI